MTCTQERNDHGIYYEIHKKLHLSLGQKSLNQEVWRIIKQHTPISVGCFLLPIQHTEKGTLNTRRSRYIVAFLGIIQKIYFLCSFPPLSSVFLLDGGFLKVFDILETEATQKFCRKAEKALGICARSSDLFLQLAPKAFSCTFQKVSRYCKLLGNITPPSVGKHFAYFSMFGTLPAIESDHLQKCRYEDQ